MFSKCYITGWGGRGVEPNVLQLELSSDFFAAQRKIWDFWCKISRKLSFLTDFVCLNKENFWKFVFNVQVRFLVQLCTARFSRIFFHFSPKMNPTSELFLAEKYCSAPNFNQKPTSPRRPYVVWSWKAKGFVAQVPFWAGDIGIDQSQRLQINSPLDVIKKRTSFTGTSRQCHKWLNARSALIAVLEHSEFNLHLTDLSKIVTVVGRCEKTASAPWNREE
jgi:hypothetical protein